jgi:DNA polymerase-3 subunit epsilon
MANTFTYLDVETANRYRRSICQVGVVAVDDGRVADQWATLVDPGEEFDPWCSKIHGITAETVHGMRTFDAIWPELRNRLGNSTVISHSSFDRTAINQAAEWRQIEDHRDLVWEDSVRIARQAWPGLAGGYGLKNLCEVLEIEFKHHDALQDALAGVQVVLQASATTGMDVARFQAERQSQSTKRRVGREGNPEGPLYGEVCVFTGSLETLRSECEVRAAAAGCSVARAVNSKTTLLVVGDRAKNLLNTHGSRSIKYRRALELQAGGQDIKILTEKDFWALLRAD